MYWGCSPFILGVQIGTITNKNCSDFYVIFQDYHMKWSSSF